MGVDYTGLSTFGDLATNGVTVAASRITFDTPRGWTGGVYRDDGADAIGDFTHRCDVLITDDYPTARGNILVLGASNVLTDWYTAWFDFAEFLCAEIYNNNGIRFGLRQCGTQSRSFIGLGSGYYNTVLRAVLSRSGSDAALQVYSDSAEENLLGAVSATSATAYRYAHVFGSTGGGGGYTAGYVENHDFGGGGGSIPRMLRGKTLGNDTPLGGLIHV